MVNIIFLHCTTHGSKSTPPFFFAYRYSIVPAPVVERAVFLCSMTLAPLSRCLMYLWVYSWNLFCPIGLSVCLDAGTTSSRLLWPYSKAENQVVWILQLVLLWVFVILINSCRLNFVFLSLLFMGSTRNNPWLIPNHKANTCKEDTIRGSQSNRNELFPFFIFSFQAECGCSEIPAARNLFWNLSTTARGLCVLEMVAFYKQGSSFLPPKA